MVPIDRGSGIEPTEPTFPLEETVVFSSRLICEENEGGIELTLEGGFEGRVGEFGIFKGGGAGGTEALCDVSLLVSTLLENVERSVSECVNATVNQRNWMRKKTLLIIPVLSRCAVVVFMCAPPAFPYRSDTRIL